MRQDLFHTPAEPPGEDRQSLTASVLTAAGSIPGRRLDAPSFLRKAVFPFRDLLQKPSGGQLES